MDKKNLVLSSYNVTEINQLPTESDKLKHILNYLEDVNELLIRHEETIKSLLASNEILTERLNTQSDHLNAHDQHLTSHNLHLTSHDDHLKLLMNK